MNRLHARGVSSVHALLVLVILLGAAVGGVAGRMHASEMRALQARARAMFYHGYDSYLAHAFPWDELKPLSCEGRRWDRRERGDLDDVLGGYALTLVDALDMLAVLGDRAEFARAVALVRDHVDFDRDVTVSVFEATIRVLGGLLAAHLVASSAHLGALREPDEYRNELLDLAVDLGTRLLPAFDTPTGIPVHRINLRRGLVSSAGTSTTASSSFITCPAAAGSLLVEFAYLSRLSGRPEFEARARAAVLALWERRSELDLLGSSIDVRTGEWATSHVGIGAGTDSYFEYLLKYHVLSGDRAWLDMFNASYRAVEAHLNHGDVHLEVDMHHGRARIRSQRISALQAFWPGLQVLAGDVSRAMRSHDKLFLLWNKFGAMPELFDLAEAAQGHGTGIISWARTAPLRPELIESTYHLYQATRDHKYLKIGRKLLEDIERVSRVPCGYAAVGNIHTLAVEDRMDSYFLSETVKYLYLLFSEDPDVIVPAMELPPLPEEAIDDDDDRRSMKRGVGQVVVGGSSSNNGCSGNTSVTSTGSRRTRVPTPAGDNVTSQRRPQQRSRALKSTDVVFTTEGHVLMLNTTLFARPRPLSKAEDDVGTGPDEDDAAPAPTTAAAAHECENGRALVQAQGSSALTFLPIGVSVRVGDVHLRTMVAAPAKFGPQFGHPSHLEAPLVLFSSAVGVACGRLPADVALEVRGRIVMVARGTCAFADKALTIQNAGGLAVIVINDRTSRSSGVDGSERRYVIADDPRGRGAEVRIPLVMVSHEDAAELHRLVRSGPLDSDGSEADDDAQLVASLSAWLH